MTSLADFEREGLLDGLDEPERSARTSLLQQLANAGISLAELKQAVAENRLALLPLEQLLDRNARYTMREYVELTGVDEQLIQRNYLALGLSPPERDTRWFSDEQVAAGRVLKQVLDLGLSGEQVVGMARVLGRTSAVVAEALLELVAATAAHGGAGEHDLGLRWAELAQGLMPAIGPLLANVVGLHMRHLVKGEVVERAAGLPGVLADTREVTVCFADLVGYTRLGESFGVADIGRIANRFADMASDVAVEPVRLVKLIGDAAMLISYETVPLLEATSRLIATVERQRDLPGVRAGIARGVAFRHEGDWYGRPINLASRITGIAPPHAMVATPDICDAIGEGFRCEPWKHVALKGIVGPVALVRVTASAADDRRSS